MARGNRIVVSSEPRGSFMEGVVKTGETHYPGMIVQRDPTVALQGGAHTYKIYNRGTDAKKPAGPFCVVRENVYLGKTGADSYGAGEREFLYVPEAGDELNLLVANLAGTADSHAAGELLIVDDTTGKLIATTGSPETQVAQLLETLAALTADTLAWCVWTGY